MMSLLEGIAWGLALGIALGVILTLTLECIYHDWKLRRRVALLRTHADEDDGNVTVLESDSRALAPFRVRSPSITDEDNPPSRSQRFIVVAEVHRADESSGTSSPKEGGPASSSPHWKHVPSSPKRKQVSSSSKQKQVLSYRKRRHALSSSRERSRVSSSRQRSRVSSSQKRSNGSSSRKRQSKICSPDKMFERSPETSVRIRRSARIAAGSSSQPQPSPPTLLTEGGAYGTFDRSQEVQALSPSASRSSHTSSVTTRPSRVCAVTPSTSLRSSPSSLPRPIRAPAPLREPQTPAPTVSSRTTTPKGLPLVPSSPESSRRGVPEKMSRIAASEGSLTPLGRSLEEQLRSQLSGGLRTKPPLSPRTSAKVKDETPIPLSKLHGDSDERLEDDEDAL